MLLRPLLACWPDIPGSMVRSYATQLERLLNATPDVTTVPLERGALRQWIRATAAQRELFVVALPRRWSHLWRLAGPSHTALLDEAATSVLLFREALFPVDQILLLLRGTEEDQLALAWTGRLARPGRSLITLLPLGAAERYPLAGGAARQMQLLELLETDGATMEQARAILPFFRERHLDVTVRLRVGTPCQIIQSELREASHDLIVTGDIPPHKWWKGITGNVVRHVVAQQSIPFLVAQSSGASVTLNGNVAR